MFICVLVYVFMGSSVYWIMFMYVLVKEHVIAFVKVPVTVYIIGCMFV